MVKIIFFTIIGLCAAGYTAAQEPKPLIGDDVREMLRKVEREHAEQERRLKYDEMHKLYSITKTNGQQGEQSDAKKGKAQDQKFRTVSSRPKSGGGKDDGSSGTASDTAIGQSEDGSDIQTDTDSIKASTTDTIGQGSSSKPNRRRQQDRYIPPSWSVSQSNSGGFKADQVKKKEPYFGIRLGTRIFGEIRRPVTNAERNLCEIHVLKDVHGDVETLSQGTIIFAAKEFNSGTNRLEVRTVKGITPKGEEFSVNAYGMDSTEVAGFSGTITTDGKAGKRSISRGAFEVGQSLATTLNNGSVVGAGVEAATKNMLSEKESETGKRLNEPQYIIRVEPQPAILMVEQTF